MLIAGGAVLVLLIVLLITALRSSPPEETDLAPVAAPALQPAPEPAAAPAAVIPPAPPAGPAPVAAPFPAPPAPMATPAPPPRRGIEPVVTRVIRAPHMGFAEAPPVEPPELANEPDPRRRAMLKKMHKLTMAKMRVDNFTRRHRLLDQSLAEAKASGTWTDNKMKRAEQDLKQLEHTIKVTGSDVQQLKDALDREIVNEPQRVGDLPPR